MLVWHLRRLILFDTGISNKRVNSKKNQINVSSNFNIIKKDGIIEGALPREYLKNIPRRRNSVFRRLTAEKSAGRNSHSEPGKKDRDRPDTRSSHQLKIELPRRGRAHEIRSASISAEAIRDWINRGYEPPVAMNPFFPTSGGIHPDRTGAFVPVPGEKKRWMLNTIGIDEQLGEEISYVHPSV